MSHETPAFRCPDGRIAVPVPFSEGRTWLMIDETAAITVAGGELSDEAVYLGGPPRTDPAEGPTDLEILLAHRWDPKTKGCACRWTQKGRVPRGGEHVNHPYHLDHMLRARSLRYPPTSEVLAWGVQR